MRSRPAHPSDRICGLLAMMDVSSKTNCPPSELAYTAQAARKSSPAANWDRECRAGSVVRAGRVLFAARPIDHFAGQSARVVAVVDRYRAVHDHVQDAQGIPVRIFIRGLIGDYRRVKNGDVGPIAL